MTLNEFDALDDEEAIYFWAEWKVDRWAEDGLEEVTRCVARRTHEHGWPNNREEAREEMIEAEVFEE